MSRLVDRFKTGFARLVERGREVSEERAQSQESHRQPSPEAKATRVVIAQLLAAKAFKIGAIIVQRSQVSQLQPKLEAEIAKYKLNGSHEAASLVCFCHLVLSEMYRNSAAHAEAVVHILVAESVHVEPSPLTYFKVVHERFLESPPDQGADLATLACEILGVRIEPKQAVDLFLHRTLLDLLENGVGLLLPTPSQARSFTPANKPVDADKANDARLQEIRRIAQEAERLARSAAEKATKEAKQASEKRNAARKFDLLLFDLDDTLLNSGHLENFRGPNNVNNKTLEYLRALKDAAKDVSPLIPESLLLQLKESFPGLRLGVFTRAPRQYAQTLLDHFFSGVTWDCVVAYEDVRRTKPAPDGVNFAATKLGVGNLSRVAVVGDQAVDIASAYQAGASAVLFTKAWGVDWNHSSSKEQKRDHYASSGFIPDAIIQSADQLLKFITEPQGFMPALEAADTIGETAVLPSPARVDSKNHFNNLEGDASSPLWVAVSILGRYFPINSAGSKYDFSPRGNCHRVSEALLRAKDGEPYPDSWASCIAGYLQSISRRHMPSRQSIVVCTIPASHASGTGSGRLNEFLSRVARLVGNDWFVFDSDVLAFRDGVRSNKYLNQNERFENVRDHLLVTKRDDLANAAIVVVLDDIVTSGATFYYADRYLTAAGAAHVHCVALAQSIS